MKISLWDCSANAALYSTMHRSFQRAFLAPRQVLLSGPAPAGGRQLDNIGPSRASHKAAAAASDR